LTVSSTPTPAQTIGPFFAFGLCKPDTDGVVAGGTLRIEGRVLDGAGQPVPDAMLEIWHADAEGVYRQNYGWARCGTDDEGRFAFRTAKPGAVEGQAPHIEVLVFARGLLKPVLTRLYFPDDAHDADPVLSTLPVEDRATLVAERDGDGLRFDVRLQGERQTIFFTV
jgi:protocatechuate 3,4-dioxygenase alpha subunit